MYIKMVKGNEFEFDFKEAMAFSSSSYTKY